MHSIIPKQFSQKVISIKKLKKIVGDIPREKKVILCHGNFDVVHPGHVRHLTYAKTKADILAVSITADKFIEKGMYRPFVPENLRALNLAAFQMVDYVIIDNQKKPIKNLSILKPDFFAKGFEYNAGNLPPATLEEANVVNAYGGEMIFTPGDVVYSSTKLLKLSQPKIEIEKLIDLMSNNNIDFDLLKETVKKLKSLSVHVIGDTIVDSYTRTNLIGGNTKTPTTSVLYQERNDYIGGAGIVAQHLRAAGAKVTFTSVLGNDDLKDFVVKEMKKKNINTNFIIDTTRPTTHKNVILSGIYKLLKIDKVDNHPISQSILKKIVNSIKKFSCDIIIFSDFRHGLFNKNSIDQFSKAVPKKVFKVADSQVATRWGNITDFKNFDLITPNEREARFSLADQDSSISNLSRQLAFKTKFKNLILKLGERGLVSVNRNNKKDKKAKDKTKAFALPSFTNNIVDTTGTGDALLAYSSLSLVKSQSLIVSSIIGSLAAANECERDGNVAIESDEIMKKIDSVKNLSGYKITKKKSLRSNKSKKRRLI